MTEHVDTPHYIDSTPTEPTPTKRGNVDWVKEVAARRGTTPDTDLHQVDGESQ